MNTRRSIVAFILARAPRFAIAQSADLIITNARIYPVDGSQPVVEEMAIRVQ